MKHIIRAISAMLFPIVINGVLKWVQCCRQTEKGKVQLPKAFLILGTICSAFFLIPAIITAFLAEPVWIPIVFLAFALLGASLIIGFVNCRITYNEENFVAKNFLGVRRKFTYDQVTAIKENLHESYIYMGTRRVMIDELSVGGGEFVRFVKEKYRTMHNGQSLPEI